MKMGQLVPSNESMRVSNCWVDHRVHQGYISWYEKHMEKTAYRTTGDKTQCFFSQEITFYGTKPSLVAKGFQTPQTTGLISLCRC